MNALERLIAEYEDDLTFEFSDKLPNGLPGYIINTHITINKRLSYQKSKAILAEEIGHYKTSSGDIMNYSDYKSMKQEIKARRWGYKKLVPIESLKQYIRNKDQVNCYEVAEEFDLPCKVIKEALNIYKLEGKI